MKRSYALALAMMPFVLGGCAHPHPVGEARSRLDQEVVQAVASLKAAFPQLENKLREAPGYAVFPEGTAAPLGSTFAMEAIPRLHPSPTDATRRRTSSNHTS